MLPPKESRSATFDAMFRLASPMWSRFQEEKSSVQLPTVAQSGEKRSAIDRQTD